MSFLRLNSKFFYSLPIVFISSGGPRGNRRAISFPRTCFYRWAPGKWTKVQTEPAPSDLLKATGMQPKTS